MMTEENFCSNKVVFDTEVHSGFYSGNHLAPQSYNLSNEKRRVTYRWCSRLAASGLSGSDHAGEYLYGKYIKNLSVSIIQQSGRIILYFLYFLLRGDRKHLNQTNLRIALRWQCKS